MSVQYKVRYSMIFFLRRGTSTSRYFYSRYFDIKHLTYLYSYVRPLSHMIWKLCFFVRHNKSYKLAAKSNVNV